MMPAMDPLEKDEDIAEDGGSAEEDSDDDGHAEGQGGSRSHARWHKLKMSTRGRSSPKNEGVHDRGGWGAGRTRSEATAASTRKKAERGRRGRPKQWNWSR